MDLPNFVKKYLWDVNLKDISPQNNADFIIERILEYGDFDSVKWIETEFESNKIIEVLKKSKKISPKSGNFYALYFGIPKQELLCIRKPYIQKQNRF